MSLPSVDIVNIDDTAIVSRAATIRGRVTIGPGCIIHPNATIIGHSPVELGANNVVEEQATIINTHQPGLHTKNVRIGDNNLFEVGSYFENSHCGSINIFESKSRCTDNCMIGDGDIIGAGVHLVSEIVGDKVILFSGGSALSKPITRKLGVIATEEALELHNMMRATIGPILEMEAIH